MPDIICYSAFGRSVRMYEILLMAGKICAFPDCTQQKSYLNKSKYCYAHQKQAEGLISLKEREVEADEQEE